MLNLKQAIKEDARAQMKEILTQEQLQKLEAAESYGQKKRGVWRTLNLTDAQKAQMKTIRESKTSEIEAILTDEEKEQFQQMRENRRSRRQQRGN